MPSKQGASKKGKPKRPRCHTCNKPIHVPQGWTAGPAVRRHYWRHHPGVMQGVPSEKNR